MGKLHYIAVFKLVTTLFTLFSTLYSLVITLLSSTFCRKRGEECNLKEFFSTVRVCVCLLMCRGVFICVIESVCDYVCGGKRCDYL